MASVSDRDLWIFTLHRYYIWSNFMRTKFDEIIQDKSQQNFKGEMESFAYMSYWYGGLFVVVEGWQDLQLSEPIIDELLASPHVDLLRRYRNGVFHFQRDYNDKRFLEFMAEGMSIVQWVRDLTLHFGRYFLQRFRQ